MTDVGGTGVGVTGVGGAGVGVTGVGIIFMLVTVCQRTCYSPSKTSGIQ